jgi:hypothetical protein
VPWLSVRSTDKVSVVSGSAWLGRSAVNTPWRVALTIGPTKAKLTPSKLR